MSALEAPIAVVLQSSGPNALGIIRSLAREGVPVMATDRDPLAMGLRSRYSRKMVLPDPVDDPTAFIDELEVLGRSLATRGVLFPTHDEAIEVIGPHEEGLSEWFDMP